MFPTLNYLINYLFGTNITFNFPPSFGFMVALAFLGAAWTLSLELKRKEKQGIIKGIQKKIKVGEPASIIELISNGVMGFLIGFKLLGAFTDTELFKQNPQAYILSGEGNLIGGIILGGIFAYQRYREKEKTKLPQPKEETITIHPFQLVGNITMMAAICGILGAKFFHYLEYWDQFIQDPIGNLLSASGLTFYGGLIGGFFGVWWYVRQHKLPLIHVADAVAPGLILAYGIGRIGCMLAGDGDWGVINSAYRIDENRTYTSVPVDSLQNDLMKISSDGLPVYSYYAATPENAQHIYLPKPTALSFLPDFFFAFDFPNNVNDEGIKISTAQGQFSHRLPLPVFPTPMYETIMALIIFGILWLIRKRIQFAGGIFFIYLIMNGTERFLIEQIRVNSTYQLLGLEITQAEIISTSLILIGIVGLIAVKKWQNKVLKA
jgi:phosphatidylglycerol:prolipoprotein diacylglycerol transferase